MAPPYFSPKDPSDIRRYVADFSAALPDGQTIASVSGVTLSNLTVPDGKSPAYGTDGTTSAYAWVTGGTAGQTGAITWTIVTSGGETIQRTANVKIQER